MTHDLICSWLGLPPGCWPPDHYTLLGLTPGEGDLARIEQQVHERMARVRRYQLTHPEPATEAMNRLAQALCCLSDPKAKQAYDAGLNLPITAAQEPVPAALAQPEPITVAEAPPSPADPLAWLFGPWNPPPPAPAPAAAAPATQVDWQTAPPPPVRAEVAQPATPALIDTAVTPAVATVQANVTVVEMPAVGSVAVDP